MQMRDSWIIAYSGSPLEKKGIKYKEKKTAFQNKNFPSVLRKI